MSKADRLPVLLNAFFTAVILGLILWISQPSIPAAVQPDDVDHNFSSAVKVMDTLNDDEEMAPLVEPSEPTVSDDHDKLSV